MELKRRGFRQKNCSVPYGSSGIMRKSDGKTPRIRLTEGILQPFVGGGKGCGCYDKLSAEEKEKLIYSLANQLVEAHPDVRNGVLRYLCEISLELGQKTEVAVNRIRFGVCD